MPELILPPEPVDHPAELGDGQYVHVDAEAMAVCGVGTWWGTALDAALAIQMDPIDGSYGRNYTVASHRGI